MTVWLFILGYSFADYLAYCALQDEKRGVPVGYRYAQVIALALIVWTLGTYEQAIWRIDPRTWSWDEPWAFAAVWWTFGCDWLFYAFTLIPFKKLWHKFDDWSDTLADFANGINHAGWTAGGIIYQIWRIVQKARADESPELRIDLVYTPEPTPVSWLTFQAILGLAAAIIIQVTSTP